MGTEPLNVALCGQMAQSMGDQIAAHLPPSIVISRFDENRPDAAAAAHIDAIVSAKFDHSFPPMPRLKLVQSPLTGIDQISLDAVPDHVVLCNVAGHENAVAEYVAMTVLASSRRLLEADQGIRSRNWELSSRTSGPKTSEIAGRTAGILGHGHIGRQAAATLRKLGMEVVVCSRSASGNDHGEVVLYPWSELDTLLASADFVIVACALSDRTRNIIDVDALSKMKADAVLINVARGECVDAAALYEACASRRIGGAVLDVWYDYPGAQDPAPASSRYPFEALNNVIMTPHVAAWTEETILRRSFTIAENLISLQNGEELMFQVARGQGGSAL